MLHNDRSNGDINDLIEENHQLINQYPQYRIQTEIVFQYFLNYLISYNIKGIYKKTAFIGNV